MLCILELLDSMHVHGEGPCSGERVSQGRQYCFVGVGFASAAAAATVQLV